MKIHKYHIWTYTVIYFVLHFCAENPFFEQEIDIKENRTVKGKIILNNDDPPSDVYIWLEGFNLSDRTNTNGGFQIELPPAESQPGSGLTGLYSLYVYVANYEFKKFDLLLLDGEFKYDTSLLDTEGNFKQYIVLKKLLDISTSVEPNIIMTTNKDPINFIVRLECLVDSVIVKTHINRWGAPSSLVFLKEESPVEEAILIQGDPARPDSIIIRDTVFWPTSFLFSSNFFTEGRYQVNPYIEIIQSELPKELLLSIDSEIFELNYHYLNWPIKQRAGLLTVESFSN